MALDMWGLVGGMGAGAGIGLARNLFKPKDGNLPVYEPKPIADRLADLDPEAKNDILARRRMATELMTGEIPDSVRDQVEMLAAEKSWRGGFGTSPRATNLAARDLGLMSLSLMQQGAEMGDKLTQFEVDMAMADANQEYQSFVGKYNAQVQKNTQKTADYNNMWDSILTIGAMSAMSGPSDKSGSSGTLGSATKTGWGNLKSGTSKLFNFDGGTPKGMTESGSFQALK
jgi:hypothetical protein